MKAVQLKVPGGPEVLEYVEISTPTPTEGEVLVRAHAIGVAMADALIRTGTYRWMPPLPAIPGSEMSGWIEARGPGVTNLEVGQPVFVTSRELKTRGGCYAEYIAVPDAAAVPLPESINLDDAVSIPNYQFALALLQEATRGANFKSVYIRGAAGGAATAVIQLCKLDRVMIIGAASSEGKCAFARAQGATHTINYQKESVVERVRELTGGHGVDLIFDHVAGKNFTDNLKMLSTMGLVVSFGALGGLPDKDLFKEMRANLEKSPAVRCFTMHMYDADPESRHRLLSKTLEIFAAGKVSPPVFKILPLSEARRAHEMLEGREILGKLILRPFA